MLNGVKPPFLLILALSILACTQERDGDRPVFHETGYPPALSDWGVLRVKSEALLLNENVIPYALATPLFSDYALKLRTISLPEGEAAAYHDTEVFDFPVGTIITKTFYYPRGARDGAVRQGEPAPMVDGIMALDGYRLIETRVLAHRADGWVALPYVWNEEQTDATLKRTGDIKPLTLVRAVGREEDFAYLVPNQNQCAGCHATNNTTRALSPIGPKARHLNRPSPVAAGVNQLDAWKDAGLVAASFETAAAPRNALWTDETESLDARARAYLDANCTHCHSSVGPADTSGLNFEPHVALGPALGLCKNPIAAGGGSGGRPFDIVPGAPDQSITLFRMETTDPGAMMPELGRAVTHEEGVDLIAEWIREMEGGCG